MYSRIVLMIAMIIFSICGVIDAEDKNEYIFGIKEDTLFGLKGEIYAVPVGSSGIPYLPSCKHLGTIYADSLNVPSPSFENGFKGITDRTEWFAIEYTGYFYIRSDATHNFKLTSDD